MALRDEFLAKREGSPFYAQEAALTDLNQTHLSEREARDWGGDDDE